MERKNRRDEEKIVLRRFKRMKRKISFLIIAAFLISLLPLYAFALPVQTYQTQVYLNGVRIDTGDVPPFIENGRTMVPLRFFSENLGAAVKWDGNTQTVTVQGDGVNIKLTVGKKEVFVNGQKKVVDVTPRLVSNRVVVPLRFVAEAFGAQVKWNKEESKVVLQWNAKITDSTGAEVSIPAGLTRLVVLNTDAAESLRLLQIPDEFIVGVSDTVKSDPYLGFDYKESVGSWQNPNFERIMSVKPQAVITYGKWPDKTLEEKLEPVGIKVIRVDLYKPESYDRDLKTLAKIFGRVKLAEEFIQWKENKLALLKERVKDIKPEERVKVFGIWSSSLTSGTWKTFAQGTAVHEGIELAGGINIAREMKDYPVVSPEWILEKNPSKLVVGTYDKNIIGYLVKDASAAEKLREDAISNPVISQIEAGKNKEVYVISTKLFGGNKTYLGALYMAKWFYPERFKDINPDQVLKEYFEKWLGIPLKGVWAYPQP
ncbi:stalk domain-containing protein [Caldanaerobacter subterraneus]|uniref:ABC transporter substrate-binding protein n=1 Tax=Caldanaerobacter subterraneus TaxID=911092 RepID=A0A7Y2PLU8_9THEO|nr:stalk domain-containing protein [Caldanaerobacter subterraneus]NNG66458.1 ABC transporter substrate-binding protein [Caldanaerobacter subterraneus]